MEKKIEIIHIEGYEEKYADRYGHSAIHVGKMIYVIGGLSQDRSHFFNDISAFDIEKEKFVENYEPKKSQEINGRHFHSTAYDEENKIIVLFGGKSNGYNNDVITFSIETKDFEIIKCKEMKGEIPSPRYGHKGVFFNGKLYIFGGYNISGFDCNDIFEFSFENKEWKRYKTDIPRRYNFAAIDFKVSDNKMEWWIIHGASKQLKSRNDIWKIEINVDEKKQVSIETQNLKIKKKVFEKNQKNYGQSIFAIGDKIYCYGRRDEKQSLMHFKKNEKKIVWENVNFPFTDSNFYSYGTITQIDQKLYFFGGLKIENEKKLIQKTEENLQDLRILNNESEKLPDDTIRIILSFLETKDLCDISLVSKRWSFSIIAGSNYFWDSRYEKVSKFVMLEKKEEIKKLNKIKNSKKRTAKLLENTGIIGSKVKKFLEKNLKSIEHYKFNPNYNPIIIKKKLMEECPEKWKQKWYRDLFDKNIMRGSGNDSNIKMVMLGDGAVGKTCMLISYSNNAFPDQYVPTVFDNYNATLSFKGPEDKKMRYVSLGLWDTAGEEDYDRLRPLSYPETDVFMCNYSTVDPTSLENVKRKWIPEIREHMPGVPIVLCGTKLDLYNDQKILDELKELGLKPVQQKEVDAIIREHPDVMFWTENSAKTQKNLKNTFQLILCSWVVKLKGLNFFLGNNKNSEKRCSIQ